MINKKCLTVIPGLLALLTCSVSIAGNKPLVVAIAAGPFLDTTTAPGTGLEEWNLYNKNMIMLGQLVCDKDNVVSSINVFSQATYAFKSYNACESLGNKIIADRNHNKETRIDFAHDHTGGIVKDYVSTSASAK